MLQVGATGTEKTILQQYVTPTIKSGKRAIKITSEEDKRHTERPQGANALGKKHKRFNRHKKAS
jgi:hypothetical protein